MRRSRLDPGWSHRVEYALYLALRGALRRLPERTALRAGSALGWFVGSVLRIRRKVVDENLRVAFPDATEQWRRRTALDSYRHLGREAAATLILEGSTPAELRDRVETEGFGLIRDHTDAGRGVLILSGHFGNWELGGAGVASRGVPMDVVVRRQSNPLFDARLRRTRERLGMALVYRADATRAILRGMREGRAAALAADQNVREGGVFVDFFGVPASTTRGPGLLAARTGAAVVVVNCFALPGPSARYRLKVVSIAGDRTDGSIESVHQLTRTYMSILEDAVREAPAQYFWFHRRWKTRPDDEELRTGPEVPRGPPDSELPSEEPSDPDPSGERP